MKLDFKGFNYPNLSDMNGTFFLGWVFQFHWNHLVYFSFPPQNSQPCHTYHNTIQYGYSHLSDLSPIFVSLLSLESLPSLTLQSSCPHLQVALPCMPFRPLINDSKTLTHLQVCHFLPVSLPFHSQQFTINYLDDFINYL